MRELSTTQLIALGFASAIIVGTILLCLPVSSASGLATPFIDALFTATTSVCVTGLVVVDTFAHWSVFGQAVILVLIQCGGLGIISFTTGVMLVIGRRVTLKDRLLLEDAFNLNTLSGLVRFLKRVIKGTFIIEALGAVGYMFIFIPRFGVAKGIWVSVFNSVSAFCNAGMDIIGKVSLMEYTGNLAVNVITMTLIILGGIGFIVWWDVLRVFRLRKAGEIKKGQTFQRLSLHSKIILATTACLILAGFLVVFFVEFRNPETLGKLPFGEKVLAALFQSVTTRTAGFATISQAGLRNATALFCSLLMFIGGSPVGTAGGIKTSTIALLAIATLSLIRGKEEASAFGRSISIKNIRKALAVTLISVMVLMGAMMILLCFEEGSFVDIAYETISAIGTVGLSRDYTGTLNVIGKLVIVLCMYMGRIGPISMAIAFGYKKSSKGKVSYPKEEVTVG